MISKFLFLKNNNLLISAFENLWSEGFTEVLWSSVMFPGGSQPSASLGSFLIIVLIITMFMENLLWARKCTRPHSSTCYHSVVTILLGLSLQLCCQHWILSAFWRGRKIFTSLILYIKFSPDSLEPHCLFGYPSYNYKIRLSDHVVLPQVFLNVIQNLRWDPKACPLKQLSNSKLISSSLLFLESTSGTRYRSSV